LSDRLLTPFLMEADMKPWFETSFRRNLVDMHIEDWDERFLANMAIELTPKKLCPLN